jgi:hypothetical protein
MLSLFSLFIFHRALAALLSLAGELKRASHPFFSVGAAASYILLRLGQRLDVYGR